MTNKFEEKITKSIITYTLFIMASTWAFSRFILDDNKIDLYKAQVSNEQAVSSQLKAKISVLENQNAMLANENDQYRKWLVAEPSSFPALTNQIERLEKELKLAQSFTGDKSNPEKETQLEPNQYEYTKGFLKGQSFSDPKTGATIGVSDISPSRKADIYMYLPDSGGKDIKDVMPGTTWKFEYKGGEYRITLNKVEWIGNSLEATVKEL